MKRKLVVLVFIGVAVVCLVSALMFSLRPTEEDRLIAFLDEVALNHGLELTKSEDRTVWRGEPLPIEVSRELVREVSAGIDGIYVPWSRVLDSTSRGWEKARGSSLPIKILVQN